MKTFKLILKRPDNSQEFQNLSNRIMSSLKKDFLLADDPSFCGETLKGLLGADLKDLSLRVFGIDWPSTVSRLGELILVGSEYGISDEVCSECGSPDWYYTGGRMLCGQCEFSENTEAPFENGDITDFSGFVTLDRNQIR